MSCECFCESTYKKHCHTKEEVCDDEAGSALLRLSTDAMFFMIAQAIDTGNIAQAVYRTSLADARKHKGGAVPFIYRDRIRNLWLTQIEPGRTARRYSAPSFTAAYAHMRKYMIQNGKLGDVDLSVWDEHLGLTAVG